MIEVTTLGTSLLRQNSYLVYCKASDSTILIDAGFMDDAAVTIYDSYRSRLKAVVLTHGHFDHVYSAGQLQAELNIPVFLHRSDQRLAERLNIYLGLWYSMKPVQKVLTWNALAEGIVNVGGIEILVHHTPGHTPGSCCLEIDGLLFTGDTIIDGYIGRTDLPGGNENDLKLSLMALAKKISPDTIVMPGHGGPHSFGHHLCNNSMLKDAADGIKNS